MEKKLLYWDWVRDEAVPAESDGCTKVSEIHKDCCFEHDIGYYHGRDVKDAYILYLNSNEHYWDMAEKTTRAKVDAQFKKCNQQRSPFSSGSPMAFWRWLGVRIGGAGIWKRHREKRP